MTVLRKIDKSNTPSRTVLVSAAEWNDSAADKKDVMFGLRMLAESDFAELAKSDDDDLQLDIVALGVCDPNDMTCAHPEFTRPNDDLKTKLRASTIERLYIEYEKFFVESSPCFPSATDDDLIELGKLLIIGEKLDSLPEDKALRIRKRALLLLQDLTSQT